MNWDMDLKWLVLILVLFLLVPYGGMEIGKWRNQDCRLELAKSSKSIEEIREICK